MNKIKYVCNDCSCKCRLEQVQWVDASPDFCVQGFPHSKWEVCKEPLNKEVEHGQTKCSVKSICNVFKEGNCTDYPCPGYTSAG